MGAQKQPKNKQLVLLKTSLFFLTLVFAKILYRSKHILPLFLCSNKRIFGGGGGTHNPLITKRCGLFLHP